MGAHKSIQSRKAAFHKFELKQTNSMKLFAVITYLASALPSSKDKDSKSGSVKLPSRSCAAQIADAFMPTVIRNVDNGNGNGRLTVTGTANKMNCFIAFGGSCTHNLNVTISSMNMESWEESDFNQDTNEYDYAYGGCHDTIRFAYSAENVQYTTDYQCGCVADNHVSCDYKAELGTKKPINYMFENSTDVKLIFETDNSVGGSKVIIDWSCVEYIPITSTLEMAEAALTNTAFKLAHARDYGCAGRGLFDPFESNLGKPTDETDRAFSQWKRCIQCACGHDKYAVQPYIYDAVDDSCEDSPAEVRKYCECDRRLINVLKKATPLAEPYPTAQCVSSSNAASAQACCNWGGHHYAAFNTGASCCGLDGVREAGTC